MDDKSFIFNCNSSIEVKLNELAKPVFDKWASQFPEAYRPKCPPTNGEPSRWQLWRFMMIFGSSFEDGKNPVIDMNVRFILD